MMNNRFLGAYLNWLSYKILHYGKLAPMIQSEVGAKLTFVRIGFMQLPSCQGNPSGRQQHDNQQGKG